MNYIDCRIKIIELKTKIKDLEIKRTEEIEKLVSKKKDSFDFDLEYLIERLSNFYQNGYTGSNIDWLDALRQECGFLKLYLNNPSFLTKYEDIEFKYGFLDQSNFTEKIKEFINMYINICKEYGTVNYYLMNRYDVYKNRFFACSQHGFKGKSNILHLKTGLTEDEEIEIMNKNKKVIEILKEKHKNIIEYFKNNYNQIEDIMNEFEQSYNSIENMIVVKYDNEIKDIEELIKELEVFLPKLKENII